MKLIMENWEKYLTELDSQEPPQEAPQSPSIDIKALKLALQKIDTPAEFKAAIKLVLSHVHQGIAQSQRWEIFNRLFGPSVGQDIEKSTNPNKGSVKNNT